MTERTNPELVSQFEPKLTDRLFGGPLLLDGDLEAGKSRVWKMIPETDHPRAVGQLANVHHLHHIGDVELAQDIRRKTPELKRFNPYHGL